MEAGEDIAAGNKCGVVTYVSEIWIFETEFMNRNNDAVLFGGGRALPGRLCAL